MKKLLTLVLAMTMFVLALTACTPTSDTPTTTAPDTSTTAPGTDTTTPPASVSTKDVLNVGFGNAITALDPIGANTNNQFYLFNVLFSTLVYFDVEDNLVGDIASDWKISDDKLTYTFTLREDALFHDGTPVTPEDVEFSINERARNSGMAYTFSYLETIEVDGNTLTLKLSSRDGALLRSLGTTYIVPKAQYESLGKDGFAENLVGSGSFTLESYDHATGNYTLTRNENYHGEPAKLKTINARVIPDPSTRAIALENGEIDWTDPTLANVSMLLNNTSLTTVLEASDTNFILNFNTSLEPFDNTALRRAIAYAIDYEAVGLVYNDVGIEVSTVFYSPLWGPIPSVSNEIAYDPEKAQEILTEANITSQIDIGKLLVMQRHQSVGEQIQSDLSKIGITLKLEVVDPGTWVPKFITGDFTMAISSQMPEADMTQAYTTTFKTGSQANPTRYSSEAADAALAELNAAMTDSEVNAAMTKLLEILNEDVPSVALFRPNASFSYNKALYAPANASSGRFHKLSDFYWIED